MLTENPEPHAARRASILAAHPEVRQLMGRHEPRTKFYALALVLLQLSLGAALGTAWRREPFCGVRVLALAYVVGATATHALFLAMHEVTHMLAFPRVAHNKILNLVLNLPLVLPCAETFRHYHLAHHRHQGRVGVDTDIPTALEQRVFSTTLGKACFCVLQMLCYALRPLLVHDPPTFTRWQALNVGAQLLFHGLAVHLWGWRPLAYWLLCTFLAGSLHPCAGHFIAEHYVFQDGAETYSYYGPLNRLCFNVGYHNEHHDFPTVPWSLLPQLRRIAPEFYNHLPQHASWLRVFWRFITDPRLSLRSRIVRAPSPSSYRAASATRDTRATTRKNQ